MTPKHALVVYLKLQNKEHTATLEHIETSLREMKTPFSTVEREHLTEAHAQKSDLVIAVGGDGTFLATSHYLTKQAIIGVNSSPLMKEGFYMSATRKDFADKMERVVNNTFQKITLQRINAIINGKKTKPALNDIYLGSKYSYKTSRYSIQVGDKREEQKSSGIIVATASGSHAWLWSAGGNKILPTSTAMQYLVREPHIGKLLPRPILTGGEIRPEMLDITMSTEHAVAVIDSVSEEYQLNHGDTIRFMYGEPLTTIRFGEPFGS